MSLRRLNRILALFLTVACLQGISSPGFATTGTPRSGHPAAKDPAPIHPSSAAPPADWSSASQLTPLPSGPGIVVCEPSAQGSAEDLVDFGAGCSRWLYFTVGGSADLGQTPSWGAVDGVRKELAKPSLRLGVDDAIRLGRLLGATHVAVGEIGGIAAKCHLTFQLWGIDSHKPVGGVLSAAGSESEVIKGLPAMANQIRQALGLAPGPEPPAPAASPEEIAFLGKVPRLADVLEPEADLRRLESLAPRVPLAGMLDLAASSADPVRDLPEPYAVDLATDTLASQSGDNLMVYAELCFFGPNALYAYRAHVLENARRYPTSGLAQYAVACLHSDLGERQDAVTAAVQLVRCAPHSARAWRTCAWIIGDRAESIRKARVAGDIDEATWATLRVLYRQWVLCARQAVTLDPLFVWGWLSAATAMTFESDEGAPNAYWTAMKLAHQDEFDAVYTWGLEMFQPKWGGDPASLTRVAQAAAACPYLQVSDARDVSNSLKNAGFEGLAAPIVGQVVSRGREQVARKPDDPLAHRALAIALDATGDGKGALHEYAERVRLAPDESRAHYEYGYALARLDMDNDALNEFNRAVVIDPHNLRARCQALAQSIFRRQVDQADRQARELLQLCPRDAWAHETAGDLAYIGGHPDEAAGDYREAADLAYGNWSAVGALAAVLVDMGQYDEALDKAREAISWNANNPDAQVALGYALLRMKPTEPAHWVPEIAP